MSFDSRPSQLNTWLKGLFPDQDYALVMLNGDAGFRCYHRLSIDGMNYIIVDTPANKVNNLAFVEMTKAFSMQDVLVPQIIAHQQELGFMCLSDFGDCLLANNLNNITMSSLYRQALDLLPAISNIKSTDLWQLPTYDAAFLQIELNVFVDWLVVEHLDLVISFDEKQQLQQCFQQLINSALEQPQVGVHRDFHSRNLMMLADDRIGVIDYQDAVIGPVTYDVVSLLRDCYVRWDDALLAPLLAKQLQITQSQFPQFTITSEIYQQWFDLMGLQRHVKAAGIFARLYHRDNKSGYLADIPLTLSYIVDIAAKYPTLQFLSSFVADRVLPALTKKTIRTTS
ncbi:aminoglycoside phosphotransferase family protein [Colwelliaceae bacterium BS250]